MRRIAVRGFASPAHVGHDEPGRSRRAPSAPATQHCRQNRFSLATLASASPHGVGPLSEDITPSTQPVRARTFACANFLILMSPEIAHPAGTLERTHRIVTKINASLEPEGVSSTYFEPRERDVAMQKGQPIL
jgi:hypothetical protein